MISTILEAYGIGNYSAEPLMGGLINRTWKVSSGKEQFILQRINDKVFTNPPAVADNIRMIARFLKNNFPDYLFVAPLVNNQNEEMFFIKHQGYFRIFPFVKGSHTVDVVASPEQAFEAAFQFGKFTKLLSGFDVTMLHTTIPDFHNLTLRYRQFEDALINGNHHRIKQSKLLIEDIKRNTSILYTFEKMQKSQLIKKRAVHHDTKISNVLFDDHEKGICVIDLDTTMPGYFISDVGDMIRTYLSPANEEEKDFSRVEIRDDFFRGIVHGYINTMGGELTTEEQGLILYSGLFLIYMQALRFLTDYYNDDVYYGSGYDEHNLVRAGNQLQLLNRLQDKTEVLEQIISKELNAKHYSPS